MEHTVELIDGISIGGTLYKEAVLRKPNALDLIEAMKESELLLPVTIKDGSSMRTEAQLVSSPARVGINVMLRQIVKIAKWNSPVPPEIFEHLSTRDFGLLQEECEKLDAVMEATAYRGKADGEGADIGTGD